mmetsp:Transcript_35147/g.59546  ORF Transcript_35147/g.59546 Transcript_35147/m.59546 type:complete len:242 (+) Transcript_35147:2425-3150(+)
MSITAILLLFPPSGEDCCCCCCCCCDDANDDGWSGDAAMSVRISSCAYCPMRVWRILPKPLWWRTIWCEMARLTLSALLPPPLPLKISTRTQSCNGLAAGWLDDDCFFRLFEGCFFLQVVTPVPVDDASVSFAAAGTTDILISRDNEEEREGVLAAAAKIFLPPELLLLLLLDFLAMIADNDEEASPVVVGLEGAPFDNVLVVVVVVVAAASALLLLLPLLRWLLDKDDSGASIADRSTPR